MFEIGSKIPSWRTGSPTDGDNSGTGRKTFTRKKTYNWRTGSPIEEKWAISSSDSEEEEKKTASFSDSEEEVDEVNNSSDSEQEEEEYFRGEQIREESSGLSFKFSEHSFIPLPDSIVGLVSSYIPGEDVFEFLTEGFYSKTNIPHMDLDLSERVLDIYSLMDIFTHMALFKSLSLNLIKGVGSPLYMEKLAPKIKSLDIFNLSKKDLFWLRLCPLTKISIRNHEDCNLNPFTLFPLLEEIKINQYYVKEKTTIPIHNNIKKLVVRHYGGGCLDFITGLSNLEELYLSTGTEISDERYESNDTIEDLKLEECTKLRTVSLYGFGGLKSLEFLNQLPLLEFFNYKGSGLYNEDIMPTTTIENTSLKEVNIDGFISWKYNFEGCGNLESLTLEGNRLRELDLEGTKLKKLSLERHLMEDVSFLVNCPELVEFNFENINEQKDIDLRDLEYCPNLERLDIKFDTNSRFLSEKVIPTLRHLKKFVCYGVSFDVKFLSFCTEMEILELNFEGKLDLEFLAPLTKIIELIINIKSTNIRHIRNCPNMEFLDISSDEVDMSFLSSLTNLSFLRLNNCYNLTSLGYVSKCPNLTRLELVDAHRLLTLAGLERCPKLRELDVNRSGLRNISKLEYSTSLQQLFLHSTEVEDISVLLKCNNLTLLEISSNRIRDLDVLRGTKFLIIEK